MADRKPKPGWRWVKFGDVVRQVKDRVDPETSGLERYVAGEHMETDDLRIRRWGSIGETDLGPAFHMRFKRGQVLYGSRRTYLRKVAVADFEGVCANTTYVLESKDPKVLLPELLPFIMQTQAFNEHSVKQSRGSVNPYVNFSDLAWWEIALPSTKAQEHFVELLAAIDSQNDALRESERATEALRRSLLVDTFRPKRGSRDSLPRHWQIVPMSKAGDVQLGQQRHPKFDTGTNVRPYLRVANVMDGGIDFSDVLEMHFPDKELKKFELKAGDILLNEGQSTELVGRSSIYRGEIPGCCFQKTLLRFRCGPELIPEFAQAYFQHCLYTGQFASWALQTTSMAHLTAARFEKMPIPVPPLQEQRDLADHIETLNASGRVFRERLAQLKQLKSIALTTTLET